ncbi:MAG: hypothetical protein ACRDPQ_01110 [Nocardioidaceae bacterium]
MRGVVAVDLSEKCAEVADVGTVPQHLPSDIAKTEARLLLCGCVLADVVVGLCTLSGHHAQAVWGSRGVGDRARRETDEGSPANCQGSKGQSHDSDLLKDVVQSW